MRVVTNQEKIDRNKRNAQLLFFASMAGLIGSFFLTNSMGEDAAFYFQCFVMPTLLLMVVISVRMTNLWVRQPHPWDAIQAGLKGVSGDHTLYNFLLPANHVIFGPNGVFAITTRFQDRPQTLIDDQWRTRQGILTFMRQEGIGNPTLEAKLRAAQTEAFLQSLLGDEEIEVKPLVVFVHPAATVEIEGETSVPILYTNPEKKKQSLKTFLRDVKDEEYPALTKAQLAELDDVLLYRD